MLARHTHPLVSRLVPFFKNPHQFKKISQSVDVNEFLDLNSTELLERELKHKRKKFDDLVLDDGAGCKNKTANSNMDVDVAFAFLTRPRAEKLEQSYLELEEGLLSMKKRQKLCKSAH